MNKVCYFCFETKNCHFDYCFEDSRLVTPLSLACCDDCDSFSDSQKDRYALIRLFTDSSAGGLTLSKWVSKNDKR